MQLNPEDRVVVKAHKDREFEGVVIGVEGQTVIVTTPEEQRKAIQTGRQPAMIGFPAKDVRPLQRRGPKPRR